MRWVVLVLAFLLGACDDMPRQAVATPQAPWHMWGSYRHVNITPDEVATGVAQQTVQVVKISYKRPETWRFLFAARLIRAPLVTIPPGYVYVDYKVWTGLGRSNFLLDDTRTGALRGFCHFQFQIGAGVGIYDGEAKWTTTVPSTVLEDQDPTSIYPIDLLPGQDIQVQAQVTVIVNVAEPPQAADVEIETHAYFAPNVHVRPDWHIEQFLANERGGS
jgi:hypothetical protein